MPHPPIPSTASWRRRCSTSPPYNWSLMRRSSGDSRKVGMKEQHRDGCRRHSLQQQLPGADGDRTPIDDDLDGPSLEPFQSSAGSQADGQLDLLAGVVDLLAEVAVGIGERDGRRAGVRGRRPNEGSRPPALPTPAVGRQARIERHFHREVGDRHCTRPPAARSAAGDAWRRLLVTRTSAQYWGVVRRPWKPRARSTAGSGDAGAALSPAAPQPLVGDDVDEALERCERVPVDEAVEKRQGRCHPPHHRCVTGRRLQRVHPHERCATLRSAASHPPAFRDHPGPIRPTGSR